MKFQEFLRGLNQLPLVEPAQPSNAGLFEHRVEDRIVIEPFRTGRHAPWTEVVPLVDEGGLVGALAGLGEARCPESESCDQHKPGEPGREERGPSAASHKSFNPAHNGILR